MAEVCAICHVRRPRRRCPALEADICATCCGTERESSIACPLDCVYLREARAHEKPLFVDPKTLPNRDIAVSEAFLREHEELLYFCSFAVVDAALRTPGAVDADVQLALAALIRTHRTLETGLVYETRAGDSVAAAVQSLFERSLADFEKQRQEREGKTAYRNAEVLGVLAFLERSALANANGRRKGRAYIDWVRVQLKIQNSPAPAPGLIAT